jgi:hypothetical protein
MDRQYADMAAEDADFDNLRQDAELGPGSRRGQPLAPGALSSTHAVVS